MYFKPKFKVCFYTFVFTLLSACSLQAIKPVADAALIDVEYEQAIARLAALPLAPGERAIVEHSLQVIDSVREQIHTLVGDRDATQAAEMAVDYVTGRRMIDEVGGAYLAIRGVYLAYLTRSDTEPDVFLVQYDTSARSVYDNLDALAQPGSTIDMGKLSGYVLYVLRGYAAYRTAGVISQRAIFRSAFIHASA